MADKPQAFERPEQFERADQVQRAERHLREIERTEQDKQAFRQEMDQMTRSEKGAWGERALRHEVESKGQRVLLEHSDQEATKGGFDCVSWDDRTKTVHIWEAKNYSARGDDQAARVNDFSAMTVEGQTKRVEQFLKEIPVNDPQRAEIVRAIQENRVQWHIRLGPDADVKVSRLTELTQNNPIGNLEVRQYTYGEMMKTLRR